MILTPENRTARNFIRSIIIGLLGIFVLFQTLACTPTEKNVPEPTSKTDISPTPAPIIHVMAINATASECYYGDPHILGEISPASTDMPNISNFYQALYKIPLPLTQVMNNKTFYISYQSGSGYAVLDSWPERNILSQMNRGCILEQPINESNVLHEFAHILDYHGIRGIYEDPEAWWTSLEPVRHTLFNQDIPQIYDPDLPDPPPGFIDLYSTANDAENFAEHFAAYILEGKKFRDLALGDELLARKYIFYKYFLFNGREYGPVSQPSW